MTSSESASSADGAVFAGTLLVLAGAIAFSAKAVMVKLAYAYPVDASTLLALRMGFALPFFVVIALWQSLTGGPPAALRDVAGAALLGLLGFYLASLLDFEGLRRVSAGLERMVLFLYPTLVVLLSALLYRRPVSSRERMALGLSYLGITLIVVRALSLHGQTVALGGLLVFGSALAYASYLIGSGRLVGRMGVLRFTSYAMTVACLTAMGQFAASHPLGRLALPTQVYALAAAMAVVCTVLPAFLISAGIRRIGAGRAAMLAAVGPVATIVMAAYFLGEAITPVQMAGTAMVLGGVVMVTREGKA